MGKAATEARPRFRILMRSTINNFPDYRIDNLTFDSMI